MHPIELPILIEWNWLNTRKKALPGFATLPLRCTAGCYAIPIFSREEREKDENGEAEVSCEEIPT